MKKLLASMLILTMAFSLLAGCVQKADNKGGTSITQKEGTKTDADLKDTKGTGNTGEPAEVSFALSYSMDYNNYSMPSQKTDWPILKEMEKNTNVKIKWIMYPGSEYATTMNTQLASGSDLPDMLILPKGAKADILLQNGILIDLMPYLKTDGLDMIKAMQKYPEIIVANTLDDGRMHSFPSTITTGKENLPSICLREDWMTQLSLKVPVTIDDFTGVLQAFKNGDANKNGKADEVPLTGRYWHFIQYLRPGFGIYDKIAYPGADGTFEIELLKPGYKDYIAWVANLYKNNLIDHKMFEPGDQQARVVELLKSEDSTLGGVIWGSNSVCGGFTKTYLKPVNENAQLTVVLPPISQYVSKIEIQRKNALAGGFAITKYCKNPNAAIRYFNYGFSEEGRILVNWGIEGDSYKVVNGEKIMQEKMFNTKEDDEAGWYRAEAYGMHSFGTYEDWDAWAQVIKWDERDKEWNNSLKNIATKLPFPLLVYNDSERILRDRIVTDLESFVDENTLKFITGTRPIEQWDEFVKELTEKYKIKDLIDGVYNPAYKRFNEKIDNFK
ncbi:MAG TPA: extracellular solute-binding protein [Clostridiales bacterium]|nr:extracellular solute-binding protein [Clostridiales bacterium]